MKKQIESFTGLRFIMIMTIIISHFEFLGLVEPVNSLYPKYWGHQILGVNFFFLLSGFGMMLSSLRKIRTSDLVKPSFKDGMKFGVAHIKKIYPLYLVTICIGLVFTIGFDLLDHKLSLYNILLRIGQTVLSIPLLQSLTGLTAFSHAFNGVAWFLSALFCIYLVSPWLIYYLRKFSSSSHSGFWLIIINFVLIIIISYVFVKIEARTFSIYGFELNFDNLVYASPYIRVFYVIMGMILAMIYNRMQGTNFHLSSNTSTFFEIVVLVVGLVYYAFARSISLEYYYKSAIDVLICLAVIFVFSFNNGRVSSFLSRPTMQKLGNMSMYLFLIHYPIRIYGGKIIERWCDWTIYTALMFVVIVFVTTFIISNKLYMSKYK